MLSSIIYNEAWFLKLIKKKEKNTTQNMVVRDVANHDYSRMEQCASTTDT